MTSLYKESFLQIPIRFFLVQADDGLHMPGDNDLNVIGKREAVHRFRIRGKMSTGIVSFKYYYHPAGIPSIP